MEQLQETVYRSDDDKHQCIIRIFQHASSGKYFWKILQNCDGLPGTVVRYNSEKAACDSENEALRVAELQAERYLGQERNKNQVSSSELEKAIATIAQYLQQEGHVRATIAPGGQAVFADSENSVGLFGKWLIAKADGAPLDPAALYFVLRYDAAGESAVQSRMALKVYAELIKGQSYRNEGLAFDLLQAIAHQELKEHEAQLRR